jgi:hypothetical protein
MARRLGQQTAHLVVAHCLNPIGRSGVLNVTLAPQAERE